MIWDLAGNVWEWVYDNNGSPQGTAGYIAKETMTDKSKWGPTYDYRANDDPDPLEFEFPKINGEYGGLGYATIHISAGAVIRGAAWNNEIVRKVGIFDVALAYTATQPSVFGFRCAHPAP